MPIFCAGLSHRTADVAVRERFALTADQISTRLARLRDSGLATEAVWLSTCNRVEVYAVTPPDAGWRLREFFMEACPDDRSVASDAVYLHSEPRSLEHLFQVASGLDSMVLGETEILGQLKKAYEHARQLQHTGSRLNRAFQRAFHVAKHLRTHTNIQQGSTSVAAVAVELAEHIFETVSGRRVLVLGAGDTSEKVARALISRGAGAILIAGRSAERATALAQRLGPPAVCCNDWMAELRKAEVLVSSTSAPRHLLDVARLDPVLPWREGRALLLIDLAVPRDIDPTVLTLPGVYLYNVDDLQGIADQHVRRRHAEIARCHELIRERVGSLFRHESVPEVASTAPLAGEA